MNQTKQKDQISFQTSVVLEEYYDLLEENKRKKHQLISEISKWKYMTKMNRALEEKKRTKKI